MNEAVVSNPLRTRAIASAKIKTDRVDALVLAQLLRSEYLAAVWQPDEQTRAMRQRSSARANLSADRTRLKNPHSCRAAPALDRTASHRSVQQSGAGMAGVADA